MGRENTPTPKSRFALEMRPRASSSRRNSGEVLGENAGAVAVLHVGAMIRGEQVVSA